MNAGALWRLSKDTVNEWLNDNAFRYAAALAYYTLFSLAPLLVIAVAIAGVVFGTEAVRGQIFEQLRGLVGDDSAAAVQSAVAAAALQSSGVVPTLIGIVMLLIGASAVFAELQDALNTIWGVKPAASAGIFGLIRKRVLSLAMVAIIGFLLLVSLTLSAVLNLVGATLGGFLPIPAELLELVNFLTSLAVITALFAAIFRILPDVDIDWSDVWIGALATSVMFTIGKSLIGIYLGRTVVGSAYGAAGSLVVLLVWIYYSSLILFLGAEFTQVYTRSHGSHGASGASSSGESTTDRASPRRRTG